VVFLAVMIASAVLAIAAASGALFLSTVGTASLQAQAADDCPEFSRPSFEAPVPGAALSQDERSGLLALGDTTMSPTYFVGIGQVRVQATQVNLFSYAGALDHVAKLTPADGGVGAWIPDNFATKIHVRPGDVVTTVAGQQIRVAGIYRSLAPDPYSISNLPRFFCAWRDLIVPKVLEAPTGPLFIVDQGTLAASSAGPVDSSWYADVPTSTPLARARGGPDQATRAAGTFERQTGLPTIVASDLASKLATAQRAQNGMGGSVVPIALAGVIVATLLVAGAGGFWATSRAREIRLLVARGVGPGALALKAVLETAPAAVTGLVAGWAVAIALVRGIGPTDVLGPGTPLRAFWLAAIAVAAALVIIAVIGAGTGRERHLGARRAWARLVPWELTLLAGGVWAGIRVHTRSAVRDDHAVVTIDPLTFVFPLLAGTAVLILICRLIGLGLPRIGRAQPTGNAGYLALRRLAGSRAVVLGLVIGTALPCGLLTYASTVTNGISSDVEAKYQTNLGAPHVLEVVGSLTQAPRLNGHGTAVSVIQSEPVLPDGSQVRILGVQPETFAGFAYVNSTQRAALARLPYSNGQSVPAILVNAPPDIDATSVTVLSTQLGLNIVAEMAVFPGLRNGFAPMLVLDRTALDQIDQDADRDNQVWTSDSQYGSAVKAILADHFTVLTELDSDVLIGNTGLLPVTWIFGYLRALAFLIGLVAVAGLVFALSARARRRTVSYVMSRRMGMSQGTHVRSLLIELFLAVVTGWLAGAIVGAATNQLVYKSLNVLPDLPPPPSFTLPWRVLALSGLVVAGVVVVAALVTHWLSERARPAEILRIE
jgi:putative ABC transport system permease protein